MMLHSVLEILGGVVSLLTALALSWVVLSPAVQEGFIIKLGLTVVIMSLLAAAVHMLGSTGEYSALLLTGITLRVGLLLVVIGMLVRRKMYGSWEEASDWIHLHKTAGKHKRNRG